MFLEYPKMLYLGGDIEAANIIATTEADERQARENGYFDAGEDPAKAAREEAERIAAALKQAEDEKRAAEKEANEQRKAVEAEASDAKPGKDAGGKAKGA
ncbi:hypothetical protein [Lysobacter capsici]|uniref:hypothetical protein n=1 Tax=Lysobacter capsici TaxID=435897 RepID=UPI001C000866|nr:hypothetical protein [Lysobacter capsici]QWF19296.1 hypothetical protein KME82_11425 [Lysobacter capsici]